MSRRVYCALVHYPVKDREGGLAVTIADPSVAVEGAPCELVFIVSKDGAPCATQLAVSSPIVAPGQGVRPANGSAVVVVASECWCADALTKEIDAQPLLFDNWDKFADKIQANEEDEKKILELKKEIDALKAKKSALEHPSPKR